MLGEDRVALLQALEKMLASLERKPELVQLVSKLVPNTVVGAAMPGLPARGSALGCGDHRQPETGGAGQPVGRLS